jgi:hypothetical protein
MQSNRDDEMKVMKYVQKKNLKLHSYVIISRSPDGFYPPTRFCVIQILQKKNPKVNDTIKC